MAQVCGKCSHVNPADASYCYHDGSLLAGHGAATGPVNPGSAPFPNQFFFPNGQVCRNFDQLAMTCNDQWPAAVDLLKQGFLAGFFGGLGRADLALAAQDAARFPDVDRGLDQLLEKIPSNALQPPKMMAEPTEMNLGQMQIGQDRTFELHLTNQGQRLLYGSVASDSKWLTFGEGAGNAQKVFQFNHDHAITVHVRGQHLRAGNKPLEGQIVVDGNGGTTTIRVRVEVPVKPFTEGVLAGALSPRQVAEKAKAQPKDAAPLFEKGKVADWFKSNGWTYPVQGPSASGLGAVQQFFEALGLATAPKVEISDKQLTLAGNVGQSVQTTLRVETQEKRPVYAHATCDQPWLDVSKTTLNGRVATINIVAKVPPRPGERLQAKINVQANGNQRFVVPLTLQVSGTPGSYIPDVLEVVEAAPAYAGTPFVQAVAAEPNMPFVQAVAAEPNMPYVQASPVVEASPFVPLPVSRPLGGGPPPMIAPRERRGGLPFIVHLLPAGLLMFALLVVLVLDFFVSKPAGIGGDIDAPIDPTPRAEVFFDPEMMRFGLVGRDRLKPETPPKKLTYDQHGRTNTTVVRIDSADRVFGLSSQGKWEGPKKQDSGKVTKSVFMFDNGIRVTQTAEVVLGEPVAVGDGFKRMYDTCLVRYTVENADGRPHNVGLRVVVDTCIGNRPDGDPNDGVPFTIPGKPGLVDTFFDAKAPEPIPAFVQVLERPDLKNPGMVAQMGFVLGGTQETPSRVSLTYWPGRIQGAMMRWEVPIQPFGGIDGDSCAVIYWNEREMKAGAKRELGFTYGLGNVDIKGGALGVTVGGNFVPGGDLTVVALVGQPQAGESLRLKLPPGLRLVEGAETQNVPPGQEGRPTPITWRISASANGNYMLEVISSTGISQKKRITIRSKGIF